MNRECSQFSREKSVLITQMYGYGREYDLATCPECDELLVVNGGHQIDPHERVVRMLRRCFFAFL